MNRFERKILAAIVLAAVVPLLGALGLGQVALREAYQVGVNANVGGQLERGLGLYREHFVALRRHAEQTVRAAARDYALGAAAADGDRAPLEAELRATLERHPALGMLTVQDASGQTLASAESASRRGPEQRELSLVEPMPAAPGMTLRATVVAPLGPFREFQRAGELFEVYRRLESGSGTVRALYLITYMGFLLSVIVVAIAAGSVMSRRVTRRIATLADATKRLGSGDLSVNVPVVGDDEIGELTTAFNDMVRDLRKARGRIEYLQRIGAWQEFARRLAHEIKNPLTPIQLAVQELHRGYAGADPVLARRIEDTHAIVSEEVATLRRLVGEFSAFARLPEATLAPADLSGFLTENARSLEALAEEYRSDDMPAHALQIHVEAPDGPLPVRIDAMMLRRAVDNLVRNALEALRPNTAQRPGQVRIRVARDRDRAVLEVLDDGPGIALADRDRVFDPYITTKAEGTGLGLPIVKKVVLEHGGEIACLDSPIGGIRFRIELPLNHGQIQNT
jgi:two-component system nitrogen regulation sensor histidine kinase NtrY